MAQPTTPGVVEVSAIRLAHNEGEFIGRQFYGKASKPKGAIVAVSYRGNIVSVTFESPNVHGPVDVMDFPAGAYVRVAEAAGSDEVAR